MAIWLVKHPKFQPAKYLGTFYKNGKKYYNVSFTKYTTGIYMKENFYTMDWLSSECKLERRPGKFERKIRNWLNFKL